MKTVSKHRSHVDRRRNLIGNAIGEERVKEMEKLNRISPVYSINCHTGQRYEVYYPNINKGRRAKSAELFR